MPVSDPCFAQCSVHRTLICNFGISLCLLGASTSWNCWYWSVSYVTGIDFISCDFIKTWSQIMLRLALDHPPFPNPCSEIVLYSPNSSAFSYAYSFCKCTRKRNQVWCPLCPATSKDCFSSSPSPSVQNHPKEAIQKLPAPDLTLNFDLHWATLKGVCASQTIKDRLQLGEKKRN